MLEKVKSEAEKAGISPSEFVRRSLDASILWGWVARQPSVRIEQAPTRGPRQLGMRVIMPSTGCLHPPTAYEQRPFETLCGLCGAVVARRQ